MSSVKGVDFEVDFTDDACFGIERAGNCDGCHDLRIKAVAGRTATVSHHLLSAVHPA